MAAVPGYNIRSVYKMKKPPIAETKKTAEKAAGLFEKGNIPGLVSAMTAFFKKNYNKANVEGMKRFAITCKKAYGIDVPSLRIIAGALSRSIRRTDKNGLTILHALWETGVIENKMITGFIFADAAESRLRESHSHELKEGTVELCSQSWTKPGDFKSIFAFIDKAIPDFENWAVCDAMCTSGFDRLWSKYPEEVGPFMQRLTAETGQWHRRVPAAAIAGFCSAENFDAAAALRLIDRLVGDDRIYVFKAVTWALRNMSKRNGKEVYEYLKKLSDKIDRGDKERAKIIRNTISQGSQKLPPGLRNAIKR